MLLRRLWEILRPPAHVFDRCPHCDALNEYHAAAVLWSCFRCGKVTLARGTHIVFERD